MKHPLVREFVQDLNDDDLWYLHDFVFRKPVGYLEEFCELMSKGRDVNPRLSKDMDHWLSSANSSAHFFEMVDNVENSMRDEILARKEFNSQKDGDKKTKVVTVKGSDLKNIKERAKVREPA